jgi:hypothetical protein
VCSDHSECNEESAYVKTTDFTTVAPLYETSCENTEIAEPAAAAIELVMQNDRLRKTEQVHTGGDGELPLGDIKMLKKSNDSVVTRKMIQEPLYEMRHKNTEVAEPIAAAVELVMQNGRLGKIEQVHTGGDGELPLEDIKMLKKGDDSVVTIKMIQEPLYETRHRNTEVAEQIAAAVELVMQEGRLGKTEQAYTDGDGEPPFEDTKMLKKSDDSVVTRKAIYPLGDQKRCKPGTRAGGLAPSEAPVPRRAWRPMQEVGSG